MGVISVVTVIHAFIPKWGVRLMNALGVIKIGVGDGHGFVRTPLIIARLYNPLLWGN